LTVHCAYARKAQVRLPSLESYENQNAEDRVFCCTRCGSVYADDADVDRSRCSQCGKLNEPIVF
jgi:ribosomal protein S27AE